MSNRRRIRTVARWLTKAGQDQDAAYFNAHPAATEYERPALPAEVRAAGLPPGTQVHVKLMDGNVRIRAFVSPNERVN